MTVQIVINRLNMTGFPSGIPGDYYFDPVEQLLIPSVYQGTTFSIDVQFKVRYPIIGETFGYLPVISVTPLTSVPGITQNILEDSDPNSVTIRMSGTLLNVFTDEYYNFLMRNLQVLTLPAINNEDYLAVVEYHPPATKRIEKNYSFNVVWGSGPSTPAGNSNAIVIQNVYWNYSVGISLFNAVLATGEI